MLSTTILLIDDHALFRSGLRMVLNTGMQGIEVVEAGSLEEAMWLDIAVPAIVLLDIQLQGLNGLEGMALLKRKWPQAPVVVLSADSGADTVRNAQERGAAHFVSKADSADRILAVIHQVLHGIADPVRNAGSAGADANQTRLTPRQCEVLDLLCQGLSNKLIGRRLNLSENTVRGHVQAVLAALQVVSRSEAAFAARQRGLVS
ncbi:MAG: response regulator transcription factor [Burkholderiaceae bacterium]|nr:response regulator transcription factor [Burkholderiaceae bacterium]